MEASDCLEPHSWALRVPLATRTAAYRRVLFRRQIEWLGAALSPLFGQQLIASVARDLKLAARERARATVELGRAKSSSARTHASLGSNVC